MSQRSANRIRVFFFFGHEFIHCVSVQLAGFRWNMTGDKQARDFILCKTRWRKPCVRNAANVSCELCCRLIGRSIYWWTVSWLLICFLLLPYVWRESSSCLTNYDYKMGIYSPCQTAEGVEYNRFPRARSFDYN